MDRRDLCEVTVQLNGDWRYHALHTIHLINGIVTIIAVIRFLRGYRHKMCFHTNLKLLLYCMMGIAVVHATGILIIVVIHLWKALLYGPICAEQLIISSKCLVLRLPYLFCFIVMIGVERFVATIMSRVYENSGRRLGYGLAFLMVPITSLLYYDSYGNDDLDEMQFQCAFPSSRVEKNGIRLVTILLFFDIFAIIQFVVIFIWNHIVKKSFNFRVTLPTRFQSSENLSVVEVISPLVAAHLLLTGGFLLSYLFAPYFNFASLPDGILYSMTIYLTVTLFTSLFPIMLMRSLDKLRKMKRERRNQLMMQPAFGPPAQQHYFENLNLQWAREL